MRDIIVTAAVFGALPFVLQRPYYGILLWSWLGYMNPHRLCWGFAFYFPFAQIVAVTMMLSLVMNKSQVKLPWSPLYPVWAFIILWMGVTSAAAMFPDFAFETYTKILKIQLVVFITLMIVHTKEQLIGLIWVIVGSIGFFGVKGGIFTITSGGGSRVWGPPGGFLEENNSLAVGLLMVLPLMWFLGSVAANRWIRYAMWFSMLTSSFAIVGSQSRGALIASLAVGTFLVAKTRAKIPAVFVVVIMGVVLVTFMPQSWHDRMGTIRDYEQDGSAMGRINAWAYSVNVANDRLTGAGLESWSKETFARWAPVPEDVHAAHSIYFGMLGDHGWPGLIAAAILAIMTWRMTSRIQRKSRGVPELDWAGTLARMAQVSFIAYGVGGAFLSLAYFDLPWHLMALMIIVNRLVDERVAQGASAGAKAVEKAPERRGPRPIGGLAPSNGPRQVTGISSR